jgi:hypothetical protein
VWRGRISQTIAGPTETRLLVWMVGIVLAAAVASMAAGHFRFTAGFATGASIAVLGYLWLRDIAAKALDSGTGRVPKRLVIKLIIRYPLMFGSLYLFYRTNWLSGWAVLAGLSVPLASGLIEGLYQVEQVLLNSRTQPEP